MDIATLIIVLAIILGLLVVAFILTVAAWFYVRKVIQADIELNIHVRRNDPLERNESIDTLPRYSPPPPAYVRHEAPPDYEEV
jgi:hypothetical protein